ncbi:unnamed protein product [Camellia sinensis]
MRILLQQPFSVFFSSATADVHVLLLQCRHRRCISFITVCSLSSGPVMSKFIAAFRELASYRELIRSQLSLQPLHEVIFVPNGDLHDNVEIQQSQPLDADIEAQREAAPQSSVSFQTLAFAGGRRSYGTYASASNDWFLMTFQIKIK